MLRINNVKVNYYGEELATLDFSFNKGITLLVGEKGSFKTSLLHIIGGIKEISSGEIIQDGVNIEELPPKKRNMSLVSAESLPKSGTVLSELMQPLKIRGESKKAAFAKASSAADKFGLNLHEGIKNLNDKALVSFFYCRLSLRETEVTMFDEPYHFFGEENADYVTDMIKSRGGYTIVTSCDGGDIKYLNPDFIVVLRGNKVLQCGKAEDVLTAPIDKYTEMLLKI